MNMKKIIYKIFPILSVAFIMTVTGCLTDSDYNNGVNGIKPGVQNLVEVHLTSGDNSNMINEAYTNATTDQTEAIIPVNLISGPAKSDMTVDFIQLTPSNSTVIDSMVNNLHDVTGKKIANFNYPVAAQFAIANPNSKVVIPKDSSQGYIKIKITPSNYIGKSWVVGFKLTGASNNYAISNLNVGIVKFNVKNEYDANYICNGYRIRPGNATEPVEDEVRRLSTLNGNTVQDPKFGNYASYQVNVEVTTNTIVVGGTTCYKVIATPVNAAGGVVGGMYTTFTGDPTSLPKPPVNPNEINYYNPVTKTFVLNCYYTSSLNRIMYEVLKRE